MQAVYLKVCVWLAVWVATGLKLKGLKVVKIFPEKNYILISGSIPGHNGSIVLIQK
jgi:hypothetical protein